MVKGFASVVWHGISVSLFISSVMLLIAARSRSHAHILTWIVIVYYIAFAGLFLFYGFMRFGTVMLMPPWIGFLIIVLMAGAGLYREGNSRAAAA